METVISGAQVAAGRVLSGVSRAKLAIRSGVEAEAIRRIEIAGSAPLPASEELGAILRALDSFGVVFIDDGDGLGAGVRLKFTRGESQAIGAWEDEGGVVGDDDVP